MQHSNTAGCILLKFYIKPQHTANVYNLLYVVSYRNSTSNHNMSHWRATSQGVVSYRNSTSNHNAGTTTPNSALLYLIEILHQTTTDDHIHEGWVGCILSKFYIKPQRGNGHRAAVEVVSYRNSTSNHNGSGRRRFCGRVVSYRNSTSNHNCEYAEYKESSVVSYRNSTSNHNYSASPKMRCPVVSYRNSTSNHNRR